MRGYGRTYRRSKSFRTCRDGALQAIPGISSSSRRTRSTVPNHTCQLILHISAPAISGLSPLPSQALSPSRRSMLRNPGVLLGCVHTSGGSVHTIHTSVYVHPTRKESKGRTATIHNMSSLWLKRCRFRICHRGLL